LLIMVWG